MMRFAFFLWLVTLAAGCIVEDKPSLRRRLAASTPANRVRQRSSTDDHPRCSPTHPSA